MADSDDEEDKHGLDVALDGAGCLFEGCVWSAIPSLAVLALLGFGVWVMA